jgi:cAMP-dependent protein kinase regulator
MEGEPESITSLIAARDWERAVPLLRSESAKYPKNLRIRLQFAEALAGAGEADEAISEYEAIAAAYERDGMVVQAIAVSKKAQRLRENREPEVPPQPPYRSSVPPSPLFAGLTDEEREALAREMELQQFEEGDILITEGETGSSLYVVISGEVKVFTKGSGGENVYLANLGEGDFFGEVSLLTGKPRTATITASRPTEVLRLDKEKFDRAVVTFPRLREILEETYRQRANSTVEAMIDRLRSERGK